MKRPNKFLRTGLVITAVMFFLHIYSIQLPDFIEGLGYGCGIAFMLIGIYAVNHDISKLRRFKMKLLKKVF
ncbi:hypothetical protein [Neobacillus mesonae]|uniref:hypothetical protein n=1 Tax=Neobacillus mesonae TaxID=1193713 RepID=UPI00203A6340|nr:hypothetical protein [Neobacillus mesonae]MCM3568962.1 hypothetical protein [Neobacillus mesonae]